jgi:hypothetical protein
VALSYTAKGGALAVSNGQHAVENVKNDLEGADCSVFTMSFLYRVSVCDSQVVAVEV